MASATFPETADIETSSDNYARRFSGPVGAWFLEVQEEATLRMLSPYPRANVLDVGGGHGQITGALVRHEYKVTVLGSADVCRERINWLIGDNGCSFQVGNILDLPYPDRAFDVVISYRLLPHVVQWKQFLAELARVARRAVIVDYPAVRSINFLAPYLFRLKKGIEGNTREYSCFREAQLTEELRPLGFRRSERYAEFFLPMVLHRTLRATRVSMALESAFRAVGLTSLLGSPVIVKFTREGNSHPQR